MNAAILLSSTIMGIVTEVCDGPHSCRSPATMHVLMFVQLAVLRQT
jgi:hypothetical protein